MRDKTLLFYCNGCCIHVWQEFVFAKSMISSNVEEIQEFMEESIKGNNNCDCILENRPFTHISYFEKC